MANSTAAQFIGRLLSFCRAVFSFLWIFEARCKGAQIHGKVKMLGRPLISVAKNSRLILEDGVAIASSLRSNPLGCFQPSVLRTLEPNAELILGKNVGLSGAVLCAAKQITVGEGTIIGSGALIIDNDFHTPSGEWGWSKSSPEQARPILIGRGVFIGARAIILKGVTIGDRAVVGAGAVVTRDVPSNRIAVGNPARVSR
ncbi:MAG: acyltransferase [Verrucomicrobiota bacterium]